MGTERDPRTTEERERAKKREKTPKGSSVKMKGAFQHGRIILIRAGEVYIIHRCLSGIQGYQGFLKVVCIMNLFPKRH